MRKKFGFTLAEVLITLGIIGVVAALTAPALVKNSGQAKIGPSLSKFVNTFETACEQMMHDEDAGKLTSISSSGLTDSSKLLDNLSKYMIMTKLKKEDVANYRYYSPDGTKDKKIVYNGSVFQLKDGSIIFPEQSELGTDKMSKAKIGAYKQSLGGIIIDINGLNGNNRAGKEVFMFELDNNGILIPYGGNTHKAMDPNFKTTCSTSSNDIKRGLACTGTIADNSWKADY